MELVLVPAGDFVMGADDSDAFDEEKPKHKHPMDHLYWIGRNDVTWKQYYAYCAETGATRPSRPDWASGDHPVVNVSWDEAKGYCAWTKLALPTEAEWEKAARGSEGRKYPWGDVWDASKCNSSEGGVGHTTPAGKYLADISPFGAVDMAGNVFQWCEHWFEKNAYQRYAKGDYTPPPGGSGRVVRGGSGGAGARLCRSSARFGDVPGSHDVRLGFRVCLRSPAADAPPAERVAAQTLLQIRIKTRHGDMVARLFPDVAPKTVENFCKLARKGFYDGTVFHRVVKDFMIQGGDPDGTGKGGPGYTIKAEFSTRHHKRGTLSMARSSDPDSAGSQFFIVHGDAPYLDGQYTVFGELVSGFEVLDKIATAPVNGQRPVDPVKLESVTVEDAK